ncbi:MAG: glycosyltransferase family 2 protein [Elusimicrobiota bacterium]
MNTGLVSIIVPTYNRAYCLSTAIDSALAQSYGHIEILIVDDASTDGTEELVRKRYGNEPRVRYIGLSRNGGVAEARNHAMRSAKGDYLAFLDSDDEWKPWKLALQLDCLRYAPAAGMIWTDMEGLNESGDLIEPKYLRIMYHAHTIFSVAEIFSEKHVLKDVAADIPSGLEDARLYVGDIYSPMVLGSLVHTSTVLIRRERLEKVGGFDPTLTPAGEDFDYHLRTCREGAVAFLDVTSIRYRIGAQDQLTAPKNSIVIGRNFLKIMERELREGAERIRLPEALVRSTLARTHEWIGSAALDIGYIGEARRHLSASLRYGNWSSPLTVGRAALAFAPFLLKPLRVGSRFLRGSFPTKP